jgi:protein TonB
MVVLPLVYPHALPSLLVHSVLYAPPIKRVVLPQPEIRRAVSSFSPTTAYTSPVTQLTPGSRTADHGEVAPSAEFVDLGGGQESLGAGSGSVTTLFRSRTPIVRQEAPAAVRVSMGVSEGLLLERMHPSYPEIARRLHLAGTVALAATISKTGRIEDLRVLSGHPMLREAAIEAVKNWRYRPYLLNGQPVEVETTIEIHFTLAE